jgi:hypothetical protein
MPFTSLMIRVAQRLEGGVEWVDIGGPAADAGHRAQTLSQTAASPMASFSNYC